MLKITINRKKITKYLDVFRKYFYIFAPKSFIDAIFNRCKVKDFIWIERNSDMIK